MPDVGYERLKALAGVVVPEPGGEASDAQVRERLVAAGAAQPWDHASLDALTATLQAAGLVEALPGGCWRRAQDPPAPPSQVETPARWASHVRETEKAMLRQELEARRAAAEALAAPVVEARRQELIGLLLKDGRLVEPLAEAVRAELQAALEAERNNTLGVV